MLRELQLAAAYGKYLLFLLFNLLYTVGRNLVWLADGTYFDMLENQTNPDNYAKSAHKMRITHSYILDILVDVSRWNYCLAHEEFVNPEYVLRDEVTLLQITDKEALFVEVDKKASPHSCPFFFLGQFKYGQKLISMPLTSFVKLSESLTDDGHKMIILHNQARCGSTLLTTIFEHTGRCLSFGEPHSFNGVCKYIYMLEKWDPVASRRMIKCCLRVLCKPYKCRDGSALAYVIKPTSSSMICTDLIHELFPEAIHLFIYRDPINVGQSLRRLGEALDSLKLLFYAQSLGIPNVTSFLLKFIGLVDKMYRGWTPRTYTGLETGYRNANVSFYYNNVFSRQGVPIKGIRFEDLRASPKTMIPKILKTCGLPEELATPAIEAMGKDSQEETNFSMKRLRQLMPVLPEPTQEFLDIAEEESAAWGVPGPKVWTKDFRLPGSITP